MTTRRGLFGLLGGAVALLALKPKPVAAAPLILEETTLAALPLGVGVWQPLWEYDPEEFCGRPQGINDEVGVYWPQSPAAYTVHRESDFAEGDWRG